MPCMKKCPILCVYHDDHKDSQECVLPCRQRSGSAFRADKRFSIQGRMAFAIFKASALVIQNCNIMNHSLLRCMKLMYCKQNHDCI